MDVVFKEGLLYLQGVKFGKRMWQKIWAVLFKPSSTGVGRLELCTILDNSAFDRKKAARHKTPERKVVRLSDCLSVTHAPKESCPSGCTAFYLNTTQCTYTLASTTSQDWLSAVCLLAFQKDPGEADKQGLERGNGLTMEDNDLYSSWKTVLTHPSNQYQVTVKSTEASRRCKLAGEYLVSPEKEAVLLLDCSTGQVIYRWPYRLLRKFGQVERGFSIEAGRRCHSGEGVFIFLSRFGPQIFQAISQECSVERNSSIQPPSINRRTFCDQSPLILPTASNQPAGPPVHNPADVPADESDGHYTTINISMLKSKQLSCDRPYLSKSREAVGEEDEDEEERCSSLGALSLDGDNDYNIYYNFRSTPPLVREDQLKPETDDSKCIYSHVKMPYSPSNSQVQPLSLPLLHSVPHTPPRPRYQPRPTLDNFTQPGCSTRAQAVVDMKETEEAVSFSDRVTPTEVPSNFKHRLEEIFSKDLAKFQPPPLSGMGSSTFSQ